MPPVPFTREQLARFTVKAWAAVWLWFVAVAAAGQALRASPAFLVFWVIGAPLALCGGTKFALEREYRPRPPAPPGHQPLFAVRLVSTSTGEVLAPTWERATRVAFRLLKPAFIVLGTIVAVAIVIGLLAVVAASSSDDPGWWQHHGARATGAASVWFAFSSGLLMLAVLMMRKRPRTFERSVGEFFVTPMLLTPGSEAPRAPVSSPPPFRTARGGVDPELEELRRRVAEAERRDGGYHADEPRAVHVDSGPTAVDPELEDLRRRVAEAEKRKAQEDEARAAREREKEALRRRLKELNG